nr:hypothetical protein [Tanacetum cinerariifolium]
PPNQVVLADALAPKFEQALLHQGVEEGRLGAHLGGRQGGVAGGGVRPAAHLFQGLHRRGAVVRRAGAGQLVLGFGKHEQHIGKAHDGPVQVQVLRRAGQYRHAPVAAKLAVAQRVKRVAGLRVGRGGYGLVERHGHVAAGIGRVEGVEVVRVDGVRATRLAP